MTGRRLPDGDHRPSQWQPGDYWKHPQGWYAVAPDGQLANLRGHQVTEHEDGTITVSPSILVSAPGEAGWHGFLERGVWRSC